MEILIVFASQEGQTAKIANVMVRQLHDLGHHVTVADDKDAVVKQSLDGFDAIIVGASVHMGKYPEFINRFVASHRESLNAKPTAFLSVCMAVHSTQEAVRQQAEQYIQRLLEQTGWTPAMQKSFAGAIRYSQYGFVTRWIMKRIARKEGGDTDTSRDYEYTDWGEVQEFVTRFAATFK